VLLRLYSPALQSEQKVRSVLDSLPAGQLKHSDVPGWFAYKPGAHSVQIVDHGGLRVFA